MNRCLVAVLLSLGMAACGGDPAAVAPPSPDACNAQLLQRDEVLAIMQSAANALDVDMAVAVTDRRGVILGVGTKAKQGSPEFHVDYPNECKACPANDINLSIDQPATCGDCATVNQSLQLARTASFFSADQTPLTSRSVRFLSGEHFPDRIRNTGAAALFGIENTNRGCSFGADLVLDPQLIPFDTAIPRARSLSGQFESLPCNSANGVSGCTTGIATLPGGVPIFKNGRMAGGVGVAIRGVKLQPDPVAAFDDAQVLRRDDQNSAFAPAEFAARAFAGDNPGFPEVTRKGLRGVCQNTAIPRPACCNLVQPCFLGILPAPPPLPFDPVIFIDGIEIPEISKNPSVSGVGTGSLIQNANFIVDPRTTPDTAEPVAIKPCEERTKAEGGEWLVDPIDGELISAEEVRSIIFDGGVHQALITRGGIRVPLEARTAMMLAVSDTKGKLVGLFRMNDATVFSIDVAVAKSRNVIYFSSPSPTIRAQDSMDCPGTELSQCLGPAFTPPTAITNRTLSFGAQPFFPSGIEGSLPGFPKPFAPGPFRKVFVDDSITPCTNGHQPPEQFPGRLNGIVFFPGAAPLYRKDAAGGYTLIGGYGVSGDGVEQDDLVTFAGTLAGIGFEPPAGIRADLVSVRGVRLPYLKFNRQPEQ